MQNAPRQARAAQRQPLCRLGLRQTKLKDKYLELCTKYHRISMDVPVSEGRCLTPPGMIILEPLLTRPKQPQLHYLPPLHVRYRSKSGNPRMHPSNRAGAPSFHILTFAGVPTAKKYRAYRSPTCREEEKKKRKKEEKEF